MKPKNILFAVALLLWAFALVAQAQSLRAIFTFDTDTGTHSYTGVILSGDTLYGTVNQDGADGEGALFSVDTNGFDFMDMHNFSGSDGSALYASLVLSGGVLYGTTVHGGAFDNGTIYAINSDGTGFTNIYNFSPLPADTNYDGSGPYGGLTVMGSTLYGTAATGGALGEGTIFSLNTNGTDFIVLHDFAGGDGSFPASMLILSSNTLYGTADAGGSSGNGVIFSLNTDGTGFTNLHTFGALSSDTNSDGSNPYAGLILSGGTLYGTTVLGGSSGFGAVFSLNTNGSGFTTLHSFAAIPRSPYLDERTNVEGGEPYGGLAISSNTLYGAATFGGNFGGGTIFSLNTNGANFTVLYTFSAVSPDLTNDDGFESYGNIILAGNALYGTTKIGGDGGGTVFAWNFPSTSPSISIPLKIQLSGNAVVLSWDDPSVAFSLQCSSDLAGDFTNIEDAASPYTNFMTASSQFFRLKAN